MIEFWKNNLHPVTMFGYKEKVDRNINDYISNSELIKMFNYKPFKAWDIARKHNLERVTFSSEKKIFYERKTAIEAFSKYEN